MIRLGVIEIASRFDLGGDGANAGLGEALLVHGLAGECSGELRIGGGVDGAAVLRAHVVALAHALGRIVVFPEHLEQLLEAHLGRVERNQHYFGVAGAAAACLFVGGVGRVAAGVTNRGAEHLGHLPELALGAPETTHAKHRSLVTGGPWALQRVAVDEVLIGNRHGLIGATLERLLG